MNIEQGHALLSRAVDTTFGGEGPDEGRSTQLTGKSYHRIPQTVSFAQLNLLHEATKQSGFAVDYIGGIGKDLYFTTAKSSPPMTNGKAKRGREDEHEERVENFLQKLKTRLTTEDLERVHCLLLRLARDLKGSKGEHALQNYGVSIRKLAVSDDEPRVVVFARLHSGIAISLSKLKGVLGEFWADGCVSTAEGVSGVEVTDLPYSEEAAAGIELGNRPLLLVTSLPFIVKTK